MRWRPIETAPKDGTPIRIMRDMGSPWGVVSGQGYWVDVKGISGWIATKGDSEVPGVLGLAAPSHWMPIALKDAPQ